MKLIIASLFLGTILGSWVPHAYDMAYSYTVDTAYEWSSARKFAHVEKLPVAMPEKQELAQLDYDIIAEKLRGAE